VTAAGSLSGLGILVTRPAAQAEHLCELIAERGGRVVRFPVLETAPVADSEPVQEQLARLTDYNLVIFVSANAVHYCFNLMKADWSDVPVAAIGRKTATALAAAGVGVTVAPPSPYDSEALLALPELQSVTGQHILVVRGTGGREYLRDTLTARGARVDYLEVYRRRLPASDPAMLRGALERREIDVLTLASNESLENLLTLAGPLAKQLAAVPLVAVGPRMRALAEKRGLTLAPVQAENATDEAVVTALEQLNQGTECP
jgi:uroporphyrinogen-III synthase